MTAWEIKGREFGNCNCDYSCPCQFNALPTQGHCRGLGRVTTSSKASTARPGSTGSAPPGFSAGPVPSTRAKAKACTLSTGAPRRRSAKRCCASCAARTPSRSQPSSTSSPRPATRCTSRSFADIEFELDIAGRRARAKIEGVVEMRGEPILNPVTGAEHRVRIVQPNGFEFAEAEIGRGWSKTQGPVAYELDGQLWAIRRDPSLPERHGALRP